MLLSPFYDKGINKNKLLVPPTDTLGVCRLAWERLGIPLEEMDEVALESEVGLPAQAAAPPPNPG